MVDIKLGTNSHDLIFEDNDFQLTQTEDASLAQRLKIKLLTFQGEFFLNQNLGTPWYQSILGKPRSKETIDSILKSIILEEDEVIQILEFRSNIDRNRIYSLSFRVLSEGSDEVIPVELTL